MANQTVYPYGTGGSLPSSIGIINDLVTGGSDKALSAEQGKILNEEVEDIAATVDGVPSVVQKEIPWNAFSFNPGNTRIYAYLSKPILEGDVINVSWSDIGNYEYDIIVLTRDTWGSGSVVTETGWLTVLSYTKVISAAESGNYIRIQVRDAGDASLSGLIDEVKQALSVSCHRPTTENVNGLVQFVGTPPLAPDNTVDLSEITEALGSLGSTAWYINTGDPVQRHLAVPVTPGQTYRIILDTLTTDGSGYYTFVTSSYVAPTQNNEAIPNCRGENKRHFLPVGTSIDVEAPDDAAYLILTTVDGAGYISTWSLWTMAPALVRNLFESVKALEASMQYAKVRVASWNLGHFALGAASDTRITHETYAAMRQAWAEKINDIDADIFCCEEYNTNFVNASGDDAAITARDAIFSLYKYATIGSKETYNQNAMFSNCLLSNYKSINFSSRTQNRYYIVNTITVGGKEVKVVCTHLDFNQSTTGQQNRALQMAQLISDFANDDYVIICADWNTDDGASEFDVFANAGYKMANHGYLGDLNTYPSGDAPVKAIDNIIFKGFACNGIHLVNDAELTDHCAIYCDLTIIPTV